MDAQGVANCLWCISKKIDIYGKKQKPKKQLNELENVFAVLCDRAMIVSGCMETQALANSLWAMAKFQWKNSQQINKIVNQSIIVCQPFQPQAISNILWSMASLKNENLEALEYFVQLSKKCLHKMKAQEVSNVLWSLSQLRYYDQEILNFVQDVIVNRKLQFISQELTNISMAFTDFGLRNSLLVFESLIEQFESQSFCNMQDYGNFIYAMAILNCPQNLLQTIVDNMVIQILDRKFENVSQLVLSQIRQAQLCYESRNQNLILPSDLEAMCQKTLQIYSREKILQQNQNYLVRKVFKVIKRQFSYSKMGVLIWDDQLAVNIGIQYGAKKIAIMVLSEEAYFVNYQEILLGRVQNIADLIKGQGWKVIQVNCTRWNYKSYQQSIVDEIQDFLM